MMPAPPEPGAFAGLAAHILRINTHMSIHYYGVR